VLPGRAYHTSIDLGVLDCAWRLARRGKRARVDVARFEIELERRLVALCERLARRAWRPSPYLVFTVRDPVVRTIAALPFEDRVAQHALMAFVAPRIERSLVAQTWACLPERGSHRALAWVAEHARRRRWCLRLDVRKFFPSVDHAVLRRALARLQSVHLADEAVERFRARMAELVARYEVGAVEPEEVRSRVMAWRGHAMHGHTHALCRKVLDELVFVRKTPPRL
jgi:hypothetical protein